jgi:hypothetical protein
MKDWFEIKFDTNYILIQRVTTFTTMYLIFSAIIKTKTHMPLFLVTYIFLLNSRNYYITLLKFSLQWSSMTKRNYIKILIKVINKLYMMT